MRVDVFVEGTVSGPKLNGKLTATDYVLLDRPTTGKLHVHGVLTTDDGERIALFATGCANMVPGTPISQLRETIRL